VEGCGRCGEVTEGVPWNDECFEGVLLCTLLLLLLMFVVH